MATIRKRGSKWEVQVRRRGFDPISRSFSLKSDAIEWARHIERQADRRELPADHRRLKGITLRDLLERYRDTIVSRKRAKDVEAIIINAILRQPFMALPLSEIKASEFSSYRDAR